MALTKRQKDVLDFLADFVEKNGFSPSYEEIANALQLASLATVHKHVSALEAKNYIRRSYNQSRSVEVSAEYQAEHRMRTRTAQSHEVSVPLLGKIAAGSPVEAFASQESLAFNDFLGGNTYALEVRGESMIEDHICSGDFVLVERTESVKDGDIVVALVDGAETTLKRFYKESGDRVRLQPANSSMNPIFVPLSALAIQGRVLAVLRKYR